MSNYLNPDFEYFVRKLRMSMRQKTLMKRTSLVSGSEMYFNPEKIDRKFMFTKGSDLRTTPLDGTRDLINFKAKLYLKSRTSRLGAETFIGDESKRGGLGKWFKDDSEDLEIKAGLVGSGNPLGRAAQAVGSVVTPGNISPFSAPIRSRMYGALIPGGGGGALSRLKPNRRRQARCPSGFEFGGRFTDNRFSTCGAQLFEIPGPLALLARAARRLVNPKLPTARAENLSEVLEGNPSNARTIQISRMAQIPRTGAFQKDKFNASVQQSISTLKGAPAGEGRMIRRDGVVLRPVVPSSVLRSFSENPDMVDGAIPFRYRCG